MRAALVEAERAAGHGDVPIGAVLLDPEDNMVATGHNHREADGDATAHAELIVLRAASADLGSWRLDGHTLVVTLEPCPMCAMAAVWARVERIVYGAVDPKAGGVWSLYNIPQDQRLNHRCEVVQGVLEQECSAMLSGFFEDRRHS
jgi:tRNA(adenine34) deaminase